MTKINKFQAIVLSSLVVVILLNTPVVMGWWDSSYNYRYPINSNATSSYVIVANDTYGVGGNYIWYQNSSDDIYVYCENSGCGSGGIAIANDTDELNWENETGRTGNNPTDLYDNTVVSVFHFGEETGVDVHDSTTTGCDCSIQNQIIWNSNSKFGYGLDFDGASGEDDVYVNCSCVPVTGSQDRTIMAWVYLNESTERHDLWSWGTQASYQRWATSIMCSGGSCPLRTEIQGSGDTASNLFVNEGIWTFVAVTLNGNTLSQTTEYIGNSTGFYSESLDGGNTINTGSGNNLHIGANFPSISSDNGYFNGTIDEVRIWNTSLSESEIREYYWMGINNMTSLGSEETETPTSTPIDIDLFLNGTQGNVYYQNESYANFTVSSNETALVNLTTNITGWVDLSQETSYENTTQITCTSNETYYNITAFVGNDTYTGDQVEHNAICWFQATTTTTTTSTTTTTVFSELGNYTSYFCSGKFLVENVTTQTGNSTDNTTTEKFVYTECEYNCSETIFGTRCDYSPTVKNFMVFGIFILILGLIALFVKILRWLL